MTDLFAGSLPDQPHPSARITWCGYPAPEGEHPAQGCLSWMGGSIDEPADCKLCVHRSIPGAVAMIAVNGFEGAAVVQVKLVEVDNE